MNSRKAQAPLEIPNDSLLKYRFLTGQASLEYFIIFAVIAGLTLISAATFLPRVREAAEDLFNKAAGRIVGQGTPVTSIPPQPPLQPPISNPIPIPPNAQPLNLDFRYPGFNFQPGETYFVISVTNPHIKRIRGQILGLTGETDVIGTWFFSDSVSFQGCAQGTDNGSMIDIRSQSSIQPNLNYDYIPVGNYLFKIKANAPSSVIIWFTTYE